MSSFYVRADRKTLRGGSRRRFCQRQYVFAFVLSACGFDFGFVANYIMDAKFAAAHFVLVVFGVIGGF